MQTLHFTVPVSIDVCAQALETMPQGQNFRYNCALHWQNPTRCEFRLKFKYTARGSGNQIMRGTLASESNLTRLSGQIFLSRLNLFRAFIVDVAFSIFMLAGLFAMRESLPLWLTVLLIVIIVLSTPLYVWETVRNQRKNSAHFAGHLESVLRACIPAEPPA